MGDVALAGNDGQADWEAAAAADGEEEEGDVDVGARRFSRRLHHPIISETSSFHLSTEDVQSVYLMLPLHGQ